MTDPRLPNLFSPIKINRLELKNRLVMAPMGVRLGTFSLKVNERLRRYYVERARGGVGLVTVQMTCVSPEGLHVQYTPAMWGDEFVPGFAALAADVHAAGGKIAVQLGHAGNVAKSAFTGTRPVAPSAFATRGGEMPRALSTGEVEGLVERFAQAARRVRDAGFDLVEFHAAHGYLIHQFLSPLWNQREDRYGGNAENRARFILEIVRAGRSLLGPDFPISVRLTGEEFDPQGFGISDACQVAKWLEAAGADVVSVSAGGGGSPRTIPCNLIPEGSLIQLAAAVREVVKVPVMAVGKIHRPELAESVLAEGKADMIALGRALLADPYWPARAAEGRWDEIRPCLACAAPDCSLRTGRQMDVACVVNPVLAREAMFEKVAPAEQPRRVMVVGGGVAGIEAAMAASGRGHQVTLYEMSLELGGQVPLAAAPPHKEEMGRYLKYLRGAVERSAVQVTTGVQVDEALVERERPDVVIVAAGSKPALLPVPLREQQVATAWEVLGGQVEAGQNVVVVGGGDVGCETALYMAAKGRRVTILEMLPDVARELMPMNRELLLRELADADIDILTNAKLVSAGRGTVLYDRAGIVNQIRGVDTVVFAVGVKPEDFLGKRLAEKGFDVRLVGDCAKPGNIGGAVRAGFEAGMAIE